MQEAEFENYMMGRLTEKVRIQRGYALKRIERAQGVDLDAEFEKDQLADLISKYSYSASDSRAGRPNPSNMDIDSDKLLTHLRWYKSHLTDYARFRGGVPLSGAAAAAIEPEDEFMEEVVSKTFALERDLQSALRQNLHHLEAGLTIEDGGSERKVNAGFIDILARDRAGVLTVIELKTETSKPDSIAQILAYMGCIAEESGEPVRGVLVAGDHHPRVVYAARALSNLTLKKYRYRFDFE
jgi:hypothetical protein